MDLAACPPRLLLRTGILLDSRPSEAPEASLKKRDRISRLQLPTNFGFAKVCFYIEPFNLLKQVSSQFFPTILIYSVIEQEGNIINGTVFSLIGISFVNASSDWY